MGASARPAAEQTCAGPVVPRWALAVAGRGLSVEPLGLGPVFPRRNQHLLMAQAPIPATTTFLVPQSGHVALDLWRETPCFLLRKAPSESSASLQQAFLRKWGGAAPTGAPTGPWKTKHRADPEKQPELPSRKRPSSRGSVSARLIQRGKPAPANPPAGPLPREHACPNTADPLGPGSDCLPLSGFSRCLKHSTCRIERFNLNYLSKYIF